MSSGLEGADALFGEGLFAKAADKYRDYAETYPDDPLAPVARFRRAVSLENGGRLDEARKLFARLWEREESIPLACEALLGWARVVCRKGGAPEEASSVLRKLRARLGPDEADLYMHRFYNWTYHHFRGPDRYARRAPWYRRAVEDLSDGSFVETLILCHLSHVLISWGDRARVDQRPAILEEGIRVCDKALAALDRVACEGHHYWEKVAYRKIRLLIDSDQGEKALSELKKRRKVSKSFAKDRASLYWRALLKTGRFREAYREIMAWKGERRLNDNERMSYLWEFALVCYLSRDARALEGLIEECPPNAASYKLLAGAFRLALVRGTGEEPGAARKMRTLLKESKPAEQKNNRARYALAAALAGYLLGDIPLKDVVSQTRNTEISNPEWIAYAWLVVGDIFAADGEHEKALDAYRKMALYGFGRLGELRAEELKKRTASSPPTGGAVSK